MLFYHVGEKIERKRAVEIFPKIVNKTSSQKKINTYYLEHDYIKKQKNEEIKIFFYKTIFMFL